MKKSSLLLLTIIILLASFLRIWQLDKVPVGLFGDEVDVGYQAYSILKTGRDYMGQPLPLYIHSLSEWRAPLFIYATVPTVAIFGLNEWGVRLSAALFGIFGVYLIYLLVKRIRDEKLGLLAALVLAILPWHVHYSRAAFEVTLLLDLLMLGIILLLGNPRKIKLVLAGIIFALTPYTYSTAVVFTPLFLVIIFCLLGKKLFRDRTTSFLIPFFVVFLPFIYLTIFGQASGRFSVLSIWSNDRVLDEINIERSETKLPIERLFHNKVVAEGEMFLANYMRSFSPDFLFVKGDPNPRHAVPGTGEFYWAFLPFLFVGLYTLVREKWDWKYLVLAWLLLAPIPASLTIDGANHATRLFLLIIPLVITTALGFEYFLGQGSKYSRVVIGVLLLFLIGNVIFYQHRYFTHYGLQQWKYWHYGYKEAMLTINSLQKNYDVIFINNTYEPSILHYLFWTEYDPVQFQQQFTGDRGVDNIYPGFNGFKLGEKLYFGETKNIGSILTTGTLYMATQGKEIPGDWDWSETPPNDVKTLDMIHTPQGSPLFTIISKK